MPRGETVICGCALLRADGAIADAIVGCQSAHVAAGICIAETVAKPADTAPASINPFIGCPC